MSLLHYSSRLRDALRVFGQWVPLELLALYRRIRPRVVSGSRQMVLLADSFPPAVNGGVYRPLSFARYAQFHGWEMVVYSGDVLKPSAVGEELARKLPSSVMVHRLTQGRSGLPKRLALEVDGGLANALALVQSVRATAPRNTAIIVATGPHFHTFVAGAFLKWILGTKLVLDYRDEWSECPFPFVEHGGANRWWEVRCLRASDLVIFTTPSMQLHALERFPHLAERQTCVIGNGAEEDDAQFNGSSDVLRFLEEDQRFTLAFFGTLSEHTDPESFAVALDRVLARRPTLIERLRVLWIGNQATNQRRALEALDHHGISHFFDHVSQAEARAIMQRSDALLLIVNRDMDRYRPGKLYSYLAADPPILVYGSAGEAGRIVQQLNAGFVVEAFDDRALEEVLTALTSGEHTAPPDGERRAWMRQYSREKLASDFFARLDSLDHSKRVQ